MVKRRTSSRTARGTTAWDCKVCCDQMVGGPRCFEHNPTPEEREAHPERYQRMVLRGQEEKRPNGIPDADDDADR